MKSIFFSFAFFICLQASAQTDKGSRFMTYISKLPELELPAYCSFNNSDYQLESEDSIFYSLPEVAGREISFWDVRGMACVTSERMPFHVVLFVIGDSLMDICTYHPDGKLIDRLVVLQTFDHDNVVFTEDYFLRTIVNIGTEYDPVDIEKRYKIEPDGSIRLTETINYIEKARPWVEATRHRMQEEVEHLVTLLSEATPEEANNLYEHHEDYFTPVDGSQWFDCVDQLKFCDDDRAEENTDFWSSIRSELYYFLQSAWYIPLNNTSDYELFAKYVTEEYREALELYIPDDYTIEDSEELRVDMEELPVYIIAREEYAAKYPAGRHTSVLLSGCLSYLKSFLFCDGINTSVFDNYNDRHIFDDTLEFITTTAENHPGTRLASVIHLFLKELAKTNNCYTEQLEETVMRFAESLFNT